ncbi:MAG: prolyl oligopeptidase family serine peptidase [Propionibacteriaceae bacterium]|nr:prolyl oligopeptidase family serine peptidase [Propionibacteriaceae bacterium]
MAHDGHCSSPISSRDLGGARTRLGEGFIHDSTALWLQADPTDGGRTSLVSRATSGELVDHTPQWDLRTGVHSYGGGAIGHRGEQWCFYDRRSTQVWLRDSTTIRPVTEPGCDYLAGFAFLSDHEVLCISDDQRVPHPGSLVVLDLNVGGITEVVADQADFYFSGVCSPGGWIAWMEYDHPSMPWGSSRIMVRTPEGSISHVGHPGASNLYPQWESDSVLVYLSDHHGFWNFQRWTPEETRSLHNHSYDFCDPQWTIGPPPYCFTKRGIGCSWWCDGQAHLGILTRDGNLETLGVYGVARVFPSTADSSVVGYATATRSYGLHTLNWETGQMKLLVEESSISLPRDQISVPRYHTWSTSSQASAWFYPTTASHQEDPPPLLVMAHSGPTSYSPAVFSLVKQFFTSRGIAVLDVNYSGSSSLGRTSRQSLNGHWGVLDVADCVDAAGELVAQGLADPQRVAIMGSSAGGFTVLSAVTTTDVFSAGISWYGIADLALLDEQSERFEKYYTSALIGANSPQDIVWTQRSPLHQVDNLACPLLLLQGEDDTAVTADQAQLMYEVAHKKSNRSSLMIFPGEGHGFRRAETIDQAYRAILEFLTDVWGVNADTETSPTI